MNKKGILSIIVIIILIVIGYYAFGSKSDVTVGNGVETPVVNVEVPDGVTKDTYAPVTKDSTDTSLIGRLKSASVGVSEDGSKVTLAGGKADFTVSGSSVKSSVLLGDIATTNTVGGRTDAIASLSVITGSTKTAYVVLFEDKAGTLSDKSYAMIGVNATVTGLRADELSSGGEYVVSVSYKDSKGNHTALLVVENGAFNLGKTVNF